MGATSLPVYPGREKPYRHPVARTLTSPAHPDPQAPSSLPPFEGAFERMVARVGAATPGAEMLALHKAFEHRTGAFGPDDPWFESRSRAFWDDLMTRTPAAKGALVRSAEGAADGDAPWLLALSRSHRGLFRSRTEDGAVVLEDVLSGAELVVHEIDEASRDALASTRGVFDGTVVALATPVRLALLPGAIFHPEAADEAIAAVITAARARGLADGALLDALLRMELSLRTLSRVKMSYAYRAEALAG